MDIKLAVIGSRTFNDYDLLECAIKKISMNIVLIVSGGAKGADSLGEKYAHQNDIPTLIFKPDWKRYGRGAGMVRNKEIISNCDAVIAFWDGISKGTKNSLDLANKLNKYIIVECKN